MFIKKFISIMTVVAAMSIIATPSYSADTSPAAGKKSSSQKKKVYDEISFVKLINNKSKQQITELLGTPVNKAQASKPSGAEATVQKFGTLDTSKKDNIEMWYYKNIVRYDPKRTYSKVELTFVNNRCQNVAYFNE